MNRWDRIPIVALVVAYILGTPGVGVETRTEGGAYIGILYGAAFLVLIAALVASWRWPRPAAWLAVATGALATILAVLDLAGVLAGAPPTAVFVLDLVIVVLGVVIVWRGWRRIR